jgi:hypothetical protein
VAFWEKATPQVAAFVHDAQPVIKPVRRVLSCVTALGWTILVVGLGAWVVASRFGWREAAILAATFLVVFVGAALMTIGRMQLAVTLELTPKRVTVGQPSMAHFEMSNTARFPVSGLGVELPVGQSAAHYTAPSLASGESYDDWVTIPTTHRGVVVVGPVRTQRGDPFGIVRREVAWTQAEELFIHPRTAPIGELGTGLLRDLEGQTTQDVSASDLAFHALREYEPGDDQRHIHWLSSAKLTAASGSPQFMVRQFLDTRRSHIVIISDVNAEAYASDDEFELALSVAASVAARAVMDEKDLSVLCGKHRVPRPAPHLALDTYSRATFGSVGFADQFSQLRSFAPDVSLVVAVSGSGLQLEEVLRGRSYLAPEMRLVVLRAQTGSDIALRHADTFVELTVGRLTDLARALTKEVMV